ncbi:MAG TPA: hypothetical protein VH107_07315 [Lacipirellulaceae bacterium]|jgi:hypothetical protein|nr:hypothetical protein [Lacipirellulaceae bacterium]
MREILVNYEQVNPTTWAYLSSLLMIAIYFKFNRFFSVRNLDLVGLISLAPALLMIQYGREHAASTSIEHAGYIWLFAVNSLFMLRLLLDALMVRRPLLEPNLSVGGLTFLGIALFIFLMANVFTGKPNLSDVAGSERAAGLRQRESSDQEMNSLRTHGPGLPLIFLLPEISTQSVLGDNAQKATVVTNEELTKAEIVPLVHVVTARAMAILSQLAIVIGLVLIGVRHFDNVKTGVAAATLYLLLPYTAMWTGSVIHALPGALLVWAILFYRWPLASGAMIGLAFGTIYYPIFLLPLWASFYWQRGLVRFVIGLLVSLGAVLIADAYTSDNMNQFLAHLQQIFNFGMPAATDLSGVWGQFWHPIYRWPLIAAHVGLSLSLILWPAQKNLATLIAYSAAMMLGTQFWYAHSGGLALAWYLPLLILTAFRPNLEDRVALAVVR